MPELASAPHLPAAARRVQKGNEGTDGWGVTWAGRKRQGERKRDGETEYHVGVGPTVDREFRKSRVTVNPSLGPSSPT